MLRRKLQVVMLAATAMFAMCAFSQAAAAQTFGVQRIVAFNLTQGNQQTALQRLAGSQWRFNNDGTVLIAFPNSAYPLLRGTFSRRGSNSYSFAASAGSLINGVNVNGSLEIVNNQPVVTLIYTAVSTSAGVVIGTGFGNSGVTAYQAKVVLRRL